MDSNPIVQQLLIVAEPQALLREALVALLAGSVLDAAVAVHGVASAAQAMAMLAGTSNGLLLLNEALAGTPGAGGSLRSIRAHCPGARVIVLAADETRDGILQCLAAGAHGYVARSAPAAELIEAVRVVGAGGVHVPAGLLAAASVPDAASPVPPLEAARVGHLTDRQRDVLLLLAEGRSTKDIARTLDLAVSTIKVHLAAVYRTVGARNRVEALCRAGLLPAQAATS